MRGVLTLKKPTVTWHAGAMKTQPNSLDSIEIAIKNNAEIIEVDVTFRPDGTPVIIHSASPSQDEGILFEEAINLLSECNCKVNLDLKSTANLPSVDEIINKYQMMDRVFYTGVFEDWVDTVKKNSSIPYYLNYPVKKKSDAQAVADKAKALGVIGINANFRGVTKNFVDIIHQNSLEVSLWTPNTRMKMRKTARTNPDNITSKRPDLLNKILKK